MNFGKMLKKNEPMAASGSLIDRSQSTQTLFVYCHLLIYDSLFQKFDFYKMQIHKKLEKLTKTKKILFAKQLDCNYLSFFLIFGLSTRAGVQGGPKVKFM